MKERGNYVLGDWKGFPFLFVGMLSLYALLVLAYWVKLGGWSANGSNWGQFGDFIGGVLNPAIGLISIWFLAATFKYGQNAQIAESKKARALSDFNSAIAMIEIFEKRIEGVDQKIHYFAGQVHKHGTASSDQMLKLRHAYVTQKNLLMELLDRDYDLLVGRLQKPSEEFVHTSGAFEDYKILSRYNYDAETIDLIVGKDDKSYGYTLDAFTQDLIPDPLERRNASVAKGHMASIKIMVEHQKTGKWPVGVPAGF